MARQGEQNGASGSGTMAARSTANKTFDATSFLYGGNAQYVEQLNARLRVRLHGLVGLIDQFRAGVKLAKNNGNQQRQNCRQDQNKRNAEGQRQPAAWGGVCLRHRKDHPLYLNDARVFQIPQKFLDIFGIMRHQANQFFYRPTTIDK